MTKTKSKPRKFIDRVTNCRNVNSSVENYYVVLRDNRRVSDKNHEDFQSAQDEQGYWQNILARIPDGTKLDIFECKNPSFNS